ncbi:MAG: TCR/Tet family MFS transporter, partial [Bacteroidota bacterium]
PVMPTLIMELTGGSNSEASLYGGWLVFAYAFMQFIFSPVLGGLSDRYGRRPILLLSLFGLGVDYIFLSLAPSIGWLFLGRLIAGMGGASITTAGAYIADISAPDEKAKNFGLLGAAFGLGFIIGPGIGGLLGEYGARVPFIVSAVLTFLNFLYGYFILPESLNPDNRREFTWSRANPVGTLTQFGKYPVLLGMVATMILIYLANHAVHSNWSYYAIEKFDWGETEIGLSISFIGLLVAIVQGGLVQPVVRRIGQVNAVYLGLFMNGLGYVLFAFATQSWMMYVFMVPFVMGGFAGPSLQGIMSNQVSLDEQGELQGALTSLNSATSIFGPPLMTGIFALFTQNPETLYFPGAPYVLGGALTFIGIFLIYRTFNFHKIAEQETKSWKVVGKEAEDV